MAKSGKRAELAAFLRSRRAKISPEEVGLPPGPRRRTPGLRREEVAQLAGVGITWYTWLEQGRPINVSVQVLDAVARTLRLDVTEAAHLYRLADMPAAPSVPVTGELPDEMQIILDKLDPLPAVVLSARYDVVAWNESYAVLFPSCRSKQVHERNMLWSIFVTADCCNQYVNRAEQVARSVAYLRNSYAKHLDDPEWNAFIDRLRDASPEFTRLWESHDVATPVQRKRIIRHEAVGEVTLTVTGMSLPAPAGSWIQVYTASDEISDERLQKLRAMTEAERLQPIYDHREQYHRPVVA